MTAVAAFLAAFLAEAVTFLVGAVIFVALFWLVSELLNRLTQRGLAILMTAVIVAACLGVAYFLRATVLAHPVDSATVTLLYGCVGLLAWIAAHGIWRAWR